MDIANLNLVNKTTGEKSSLRPWQEPAVEMMVSQPYCFVDHEMGLGKSVIAVAASQELFNRGEIDLAIVFTLKSVKPDFRKLYEQATPLCVVQPEGPKAQRKKKYAAGAQVYILNYEKMRRSVDFDFLAELIRGKRVAWCLDEVQKILTENQASSGFDELLEITASNTVWPMSASITNGDPLKMRRIYDWAPVNPLGSEKEFIREYCTYERTVKVGTGRFKKSFVQRDWNIGLMKEIPGLVSHLTSRARKTDPEVREHFKGMTFEPVSVEMDSRLMEVYEALKTSVTKDELIGFYNSMRATCLHPQSHLNTSGSISKKLVDLGLDFTSYKNTKLERMCEDISTIVSEGDKAVVFTHWTNLSLVLIARALDKLGIGYATHTGEMNSRQREIAKDSFMNDPGCKVFLTSDAGSHGLSLQVARYVLNYDCPTSYDLLKQRNARIDRTDSYLDGLTARVYFYENTLEEKIWKVMNYRRVMSAALHGTVEELDRPEIPENESEMTAEAAAWLIGIDLNELA